MSNSRQSAAGGPRHRTVEISVGLLAALLGLITIYGSLKVGIGWGAEGPRSGFFPFYIGLIIFACSLVNIFHAWILNRKPLFAEWGQLRQVFFVVLPTAIYVGAIGYTGIYLASTVLIALFMKWLGRYSWPTTAAVSIGVPIALYLMFEKWFLVPLPKGPIEDWFGL
jgi:putative tricarboxylic transport membrane protein